MKEEYPALLSPGFHDMGLDDLEVQFVQPFNPGERRRYLVGRFHALVSRITALGLNCEIWVDGSFTTEKEEPDDIDAVFFVDAGQLAALDQAGQSEMSYLFARDNKTTIKLRYNCDVYLALKGDKKWSDYWENWFGTFRDRITPKGIARILPNKP